MITRIQNVFDVIQPQRICYVLGTIAVVASTYGGLLLFAEPLERQRQQIDRETRSLEALEDILPDVVKEAGTLHDAIDEARSKLETRFQRLPVGADEAGFLSQLTGLSKECGLEMADFRPASTLKTNGPSELLVTISLEGPYSGICNFVSRLEKIPRLIRTDGFQLRPADKGLCVAELQLCAYYRAFGEVKKSERK